MCRSPLMKFNTVTWQQFVHSAQSSQKKILGGAWDVKEWLWSGAESFPHHNSTGPEVKPSPRMKTWTNFHASKNDSDQVPDTWWWLIALQDVQVCLWTCILLQLRTTQKKVKIHIFCDTFGHYSQLSVTHDETTISLSSEPLVTCDWTPGRNGTVCLSSHQKVGQCYRALVVTFCLLTTWKDTCVWVL